MAETPSAEDLAAQLLASQSATIYVDADLTDEAAAAMLTAEPPLHVEHDVVRDKWAVRTATAEEVEAATAEAETPAEPAPIPASF